MLKVQFGNKCFSVTSDNGRFLDGLKKLFLTTETDQPDFLFNVAFLSDSANIKRKKNLKPFWYGRTSGYFRWSRRQVDILFKDKEVILRPFNFLPVLLSVFYFLERVQNAEYRNVFLHAAGIIKDEKGYIFAGPSQSGKSTICEFSMPQSTVINDELVLMSKRYGRFWLLNSPIKGKVYKSIPHKEKIKAIFVLKQDQEDVVTKIEGSEAVTKLLPCIVFDECFRFLSEFEYMAERFKLACAIASEVPTYELYFKKGNRFWDSIYNQLDL
jgi:hypothetical protein